MIEWVSGIGETSFVSSVSVKLIILPCKCMPTPRKHPPQTTSSSSAMSHKPGERSQPLFFISGQFGVTPPPLGPTSQSLMVEL